MSINRNRRSYRRPGHIYRSKGSLALILPTAWAPSAYMAADGHTFRSAHETGAPQQHHKLQRLHDKQISVTGMHKCGSSATPYAPATPLPTPDPPQNAYDPSENPVSQPPVSDKALDSCSSHKTIPRTRFHLSVSCCSKKCKP